MNDQSETAMDSRHRQLLEATPIPLIWLLGKTGSGKTSIVRYLTGANDADIGNGFRPQTGYSRQFDFPDPQAPVVRFLDTRGLGESGYDPAIELAELDNDAHLTLVTVRATDHAVEELMRVLKQIRQSHPERPVLLVLSALHDGYPGAAHPDPDPFGGPLDQLPESVPADLRKSISAQLDRFGALADRVVAIDLTQPAEGYQPPNLGGLRLRAAILEMLPSAYRLALMQMDELSRSLAEAHYRTVSPVILGYSTLAASAAAVPIPWVDIPLVLGIQSRLAWRLAKLNQQTLDARTIATVSTAMGSRIAARMAVRESLKVIPWVGSAVNAAATFAWTFATGWAWNWYFMQVSQGHIPSARELRDVYHEQLKRGESFWKATNEKNSAS